jgi:hypothetical protein
MNRICLRWVAGGVLLLSALTLLTCGHDQQLVSISVQPATQTFGAADIPLISDAGLNVQLRALGSYIHPPVTKDITDKVAWASNIPDMVTVNSAGLLTATGLVCGNALVSATATTNSSAGNISSSGAIVTGYMAANVVCFTGTGPQVTVNFVSMPASAAGTVTSSPAGLGCAATCSASFPTGTNLTLTATPNPGSTFGGWAGCQSTLGTACVIDNLTNNVTVTVTFN